MELLIEGMVVPSSSLRVQLTLFVNEVNGASVGVVLNVEVQSVSLEAQENIVRPSR
jgi:hypothetical protein